MAIPGPYSGVSTLAFVARASALTFGVVYGSLKLSYLKLLTGEKFSITDCQRVKLKGKAKKAQRKAEAKTGHH